MNNKKTDIAFIILFGIFVGLFAIVFFVGLMITRANNINAVSVDVTEEECELPVYTAQGDYALCLKKKQ